VKVVVVPVMTAAEDVVAAAGHVADKNLVAVVAAAAVGVVEVAGRCIDSHIDPYIVVLCSLLIVTCIGTQPPAGLPLVRQVCATNI
jgi:hypothetical protein